jgi:hypothetical protein
VRNPQGCACAPPYSHGGRHWFESSAAHTEGPGTATAVPGPSPWSEPTGHPAPSRACSENGHGGQSRRAAASRRKHGRRRRQLLFSMRKLLWSGRWRTPPPPPIPLPQSGGEGRKNSTGGGITNRHNGPAASAAAPRPGPYPAPAGHRRPRRSATVCGVRPDRRKCRTTLELRTRWAHHSTVPLTNRFNGQRCGRRWTLARSGQGPDPGETQPRRRPGQREKRRGRPVAGPRVPAHPGGPPPRGRDSPRRLPLPGLGAAGPDPCAARKTLAFARTTI